MKAHPNVLGLMASPDRDGSVKAVSLALLRIRTNHGLTCAQIGKILECSADTIENAINEKSLPGFVHIARIGYFFPEEFAVVEGLWLARAPQEVTVIDRLERIERELAAIRREAA